MRARNPEAIRLRAGTARALAGLIVAGLTIGGAASVVLRAAGEWAEPDVAQAQTVSNAPEKAAEAKAVVQKVSHAMQPAKAASQATANRVAAAVTPAQKASPGKTPAAAKTKAPAAVVVRPGVQPLTQLDDPITYQYNALGRRDPFNPLLGGEYVGVDMGGNAPLDVGSMKVVGVVWGAEDKFALVEDGRGNSHILRTGDKVMDGYVQDLKRDAVVVNLTVDGQSQSVAIPLTKKGDQSNANR